MLVISSFGTSRDLIVNTPLRPVQYRAYLQGFIHKVITRSCVELLQCTCLPVGGGERAVGVVGCWPNRSCYQTTAAPLPVRSRRSDIARYLNTVGSPCVRMLPGHSDVSLRLRNSQFQFHFRFQQLSISVSTILSEQWAQKFTFAAINKQIIPK